MSSGAILTAASAVAARRGFTAEEDSGQILLVRDRDVTLAADGLNWTNEVRISPDAFDAEGALWVVCVISNRLIRVAPDLTWTVLFEDVDPTELDRVAAAHAHGRLTWDDISRSRRSRVSNLTSVAFGGPDLKMLYLGGLGVEQVQVLRSPVAGIPLEHWGEA